jgi:signal transduction histidine kinase
MPLRFPKPSPRHLIRALWAWLAVCAVALTIIWLLAFYNTVKYVSKAQEAEVSLKTQALTETFTQLERSLVRSILDLTSYFEAGTLSLSQLDEKRQELGPLYRLHMLDATGDRTHPQDSGPAFPASFFAEFRHYELITDSFHAIKSSELKKDASYLFAVEPNRHGQYLVIELALDHVYGSWLAEQFETLDFGPGVSYRLVDPQTVKPSPHPHDDLNLNIDLSANRPEVSANPHDFVVKGISPNNPNFQHVLISVDSGEIVKPVIQGYGAALLAGMLFLASFGVALYLAGKGVRKELELAQARTNFTSMVSHELKTPVAAIRMYAEILENRMVDDPGKVNEYHHIIGAEADRLKRLIENLLSLGNIERGTMTYRVTPEDLNQVVERSAQQASVAFPEGPSLELKLTPELPATMMDVEAAQQAIANLIHNAFKYGGGAVTVSTRQAAGDVLVEVADRGPGIPASKRKAIFDPYVRLENEATRDSQGTGLGLALVRGFVEGQGGRITVGDRPGGGAVFTVSFPIAKGA